MSVVIQFPNQRERIELRHRQRLLKRKAAFGRVGTCAKQVILGVSYGLRLILASTLHYTIVCLLIFLGCLQKPVLVVSALACLVNCLTFNH